MLVDRQVSSSTEPGTHHNSAARSPTATGRSSSWEQEPLSPPPRDQLTGTKARIILPHDRSDHGCSRKAAQAC